VAAPASTHSGRERGLQRRREALQVSLTQASEEVVVVDGREEEEVVSALLAGRLQQLVELLEVGERVRELAGVLVGHVVVRLRFDDHDLIGLLSEEEEVGVELAALRATVAAGLEPVPRLRLDFAIAVLTAVGVIIAGLFAYAKNIKPDNPTWILKLAPFLLAVVVVGALLKLRKDRRPG
jgi:hypothetical protein